MSVCLSYNLQKRVREWRRGLWPHITCKKLPMISCYSHLLFKLRDPLRQQRHTVCFNVVCGKNEVHKSLCNTCSWFTMHHTFLILPLLVMQVFHGLCRRPKPWIICVSSTWSSASTSPMRLWGRDWATAGSIQPAVESTTWASTHLESRSHYSFCFSL